jgi:hypothetical protein
MRFTTAVRIGQPHAQLFPREILCGKTRAGADSILLDDLLMIADHNAYHLGELILLRRLLGAWT